ncbi:ras guanine nucleotide exchange factor a [Anaeramoeba flamelloides]|uniref:Ras guanine nucleotide exchange factor a n=1 Tax=Anaeramoeba flamelloides TaxID=1746091 RepID=A0ABQ8YHB9_9EUKA|nr:ras guanine nucleotide exchange factor a [Anaeramoeba flamelloides]
MSKTPKLKIGDRVKERKNIGTIKYIGKTINSKEKIVYGIEFDEKVGKNNGTIEETTYFKGKRKHCKFVSRNRIEKIKTKKNKKNKDKKKKKKKKVSSESENTTPSSSSQISNSLEESESSNENESSESETETKKQSQDAKEKEKEVEEKIDLEIEQIWNEKDDSSILEEIKKINEQIKQISIKRIPIEEQITIYDDSLEGVDNLEITEEDEQNQDLEIQHLEKDIESLLKSLKDEDEKEEKNQEKVIELKTEIEKMGNNEQSKKVEEKKDLLIKTSNQFEELKEENEQCQQETHDLKKLIESMRSTHQIKINGYKKRIEKMDEEILKVEERKKNFGNEIMTKKGKELLEKKIVHLEKHLKFTKQHIFDLELGRNDLQIRMKSIMEYNDNIDRRNWKHRVMNKNPEIVDLRERVNPLQRAISFAKYYSGAKVQVNELLTKKIVNQLIMQHFEYERKQAIREKIEEVFSTPYHDIQLSDSRLRYLLRTALQEIEKIWDLLMSDTNRFGPTKEDKKNILEGKIDELGLDMVADENDINIWKEPEDNPKNVIYESGIDPKKIDKSARLLDILHCANINKLVEKLTNDQTEVRFRDAFIMTYQSFMKPEQLLNKLKQRYNVPPKKANENEKDWLVMRDMTQVRVVSALNSWIKSGWADIDDKLLYRLIDFIKTTIVPDRKASGLKLIKLIDDMKAQKAISQLLNLKEQPPEVIIPKNLFRDDFSLLEVDELEFARQFTLMISELFRNIKPSELVTEAWQKKGLRSKATNVLTLINKFNEYSNYIATQIVHPEKAKDRAKMYARFLKIGKAFIDMNNFDSLMSTIAGYTNSAVKRLKLTIAEVPKNVTKYLIEFKSILKHNQGYKEYRERLDKTEPPLVPYLGVFLTDITFISSGSPSTIDGLINFSKRKLLYNVVNKIQEYQRVRFKFHSIHQIQILLRKVLHSKNDKELYKESLKREGRN